MATLPKVELGLLRKPEDPALLTSPYFPTKVGGKPAWLDPIHLPTPAQLACQHCGKPCVLLLQLYAPLSDDPSVYHRSLFIFMCKDSACHESDSTEPFRVLRCNLAKDNPFYPEEDENTSDSSENGDGSYEPDSSSSDMAVKPDVMDAYEERIDFSSSNTELGGNVGSMLEGPPLCLVCGCMARKHCAKCKVVNYCSRNHQIADWKRGHKNLCEKFAAGM